MVDFIFFVVTNYLVIQLLAAVWNKLSIDLKWTVNCCAEHCECFNLAITFGPVYKSLVAQSKKTVSKLVYS